MPIFAQFGLPPPDLCTLVPGARQFSPLIPGSFAIEENTESFDSMAMLAPPGTIERRYILAKTIEALSPQGKCTVLAPKDKGGSRIAKELRQFGCEVEEEGKSHHRICVFTKPANPIGLQEAIAEGSPCFLPELGFHTQPGVFSWNRVDIGTQMLIELMPDLTGRGADFGCGLGILAKKIFGSKKVQELHLVDIDGRAIACAKKNIQNPRAHFYWADIRKLESIPKGLDFIVSNPPFHDAGQEDQSLGQSFLKQAAKHLRVGGVFWLVANRHLPYEEVLREFFSEVREVNQANGFKIYEAIK